MYIVHVHVKVKPESIQDFSNASFENASNSILEPGVIRFDVIQEIENPEQFVLVEVYKTVEDAGKHKETAHYLKWRDRVAEMMAQPRVGIKYSNIFPTENEW